MRTTLLILALFSLTACSSESISGRTGATSQTNTDDSKKSHKKRDLIESDVLNIRGGVYDSSNTYSNVGILYYFGAGEYFCSATLVRNNILLTAAHCVDSVINSPEKWPLLKFSNTKALTQSMLDSQFPGTPYPISIRYRKIPPAGMMVADVPTDIALIKLSQPVPNYNATGIRLFSQASQNPANGIALSNLALAIGYGLDSDSEGNFWDGQRKSASLKFNSVPVTGAYIFKPSATKQIICSGDSGGPMTMNSLIIGISSAVDITDCSETSTSYFASTGFNLSWINKTLQELDRSCAPLAGDFDLNGKVERADYDIWKSHYGTDPATFVDGDANHDNRIDSADYTVWRNNSGAVENCP